MIFQNKKKIAMIFKNPEPKNPENLCGSAFLYNFCIDSIWKSAVLQTYSFFLIYAP